MSETQRNELKLKELSSRGDMENQGSRHQHQVSLFPPPAFGVEREEMQLLMLGTGIVQYRDCTVIYSTEIDCIVLGLWRGGKGGKVRMELSNTGGCYSTCRVV